MYYLNNTGHRWITEDQRFAFYINGQYSKTRKAVCYEAFGNFALHVFKLKGKTYKCFARDTEKHDNLPIIDLERSTCFSK
jgi:hypothetical protein